MSAVSKKLVSVGPGQRQVMVTPVSFSSSARASERETTKALVAW
jgi:hypothetical protein